MAEGIDLRQDGRIRLVFPGETTVWLRRPTLGEFEDLSDRVDQLQSDVEDFGLAVFEDTPTTGSLSQSEQVAAARKANAQVKELRKRRRAIPVAWFGEVLAALADDQAAVPERKAWPAWAGDEQNLARIPRHWLTSPFLSSDREEDPP